VFHGLEAFKIGLKMAAYTIIGSDGKQYGSVTEEQLRKWIADGRVNAQTRTQIEGASGWKSLSDFPEFAGALAGSAPPPLPLPASTPAVPAKTSSLAVTSLVLGILGLFTCGITALIGLVFGIIALVKVSDSRGALRGFGVALAGIIVSGIFLFMIPVYAALLLPALAAAKQKAQAINCVSNEKQLALAVRIYSNNNANRFPPAATWCDAIKADVGSEKVFKCVAANSGSACDYAFNARLDGLDEGKIAPDTVMIFESDGGWNANGGPELMIGKPRHAGVFVVAFADGSVQQLRESQINTLRWDP
jgi:prepilin-type processing-associated H-X9-DG protein